MHHGRLSGQSVEASCTHGPCRNATHGTWIYTRHSACNPIKAELIKVELIRISAHITMQKPSGAAGLKDKKAVWCTTLYRKRKRLLVIATTLIPVWRNFWMDLRWENFCRRCKVPWTHRFQPCPCLLRPQSKGDPVPCQW
jgi:hypothetical protein